MATFFKNELVSGLGTVTTQIYTVPNATNTTVIGMALTNITVGNVAVDVQIEDESSSRVHYIKNVIIPPGNSLRAVTQSEKLILEPFNSIYVTTDTEGGIDLALSYVEIS
jgi:hypothetical protein